MKHAVTYARAVRACRVGAVNQAVAANLCALLFVPLMRLYGFTYLQLGLQAAVCYGAQLLADAVLIFLIDRLPRRALAAAAGAAGCAGVVFFGCVPWLFPAGAGVYGGMLAAAAVFAFAGGMLEVVLSNIADALPASGGIYAQRTVYAWAQAGLAVYLYAFLRLFGVQRWNFALFPLAAVPLLLPVLLARAPLPAPAKEAPVRAAFRPVYLAAVFAVLLGCGAEAAMNQWIGAYAAQVCGADAALLGSVLFCLLLGGGGAVFSRLQRRGGASAAASAVAALCGGAAYLGAAACPLPALSLVCALACGFFVGVLSPGAMTAASGALPYTGGWMLASLALAQDVGGAAFPLLAGAVSDAAGMRVGFSVAAAAPLLAAACLLYMRPRGRALPLRAGRAFRFRKKNR